MSPALVHNHNVRGVVQLQFAIKTAPVATYRYDKRKAFMEGMLSAEARRLENQARFVMEKIGGVITIENRSKRDLVRLLRGRHYDPDPVRAWKECIDKLAAIEEAAAARRQAGEPVDEAEGSDGSGDVAVDEDVARGAADYNYILGMPLWSLSKERKEDLLAQRDKKQAELATLMKKTNKDLWREDLDELEAALKVSLPAFGMKITAFLVLWTHFDVWCFGLPSSHGKFCSLRLLECHNFSWIPFYLFKTRELGFSRDCRLEMAPQLLAT